MEQENLAWVMIPSLSENLINNKATNKIILILVNFLFNLQIIKMKSYEELINQVKDLIRKNKTNKALEILAKEQLSSLDKQLILINSRYSKLKEDQTLGILDEETSQRRLNIINVELLALAEKIGKHQNVEEIKDVPAEEIPAVTEDPTPTPPTQKTIKQTPAPAPISKPKSEGNSKSKLLIGGTIGILLVAMIAFFGMKKSTKNAEKAKQEQLRIDKKKRQQEKEKAEEVAKNIQEEADRKKAAERKKNIVLGKSFEGGIIFYIDKTGQHGLIKAKGDQSDKPIDWFTETKGKAFATDTEIYAGEKNTKLLVAKFKEKNHPAQLCKNFEFDGYKDWYLPSKDELDLLYEYNKTVPRAQRLEPAYYWSSTEMSSQDVYYRSFHNGKSYTWIKNNKAKVRAIRKF